MSTGKGVFQEDPVPGSETGSRVERGHPSNLSQTHLPLSKGLDGRDETGAGDGSRRLLYYHQSPEGREVSLERERDKEILSVSHQIFTQLTPGLSDLMNRFPSVNSLTL